MGTLPGQDTGKVTIPFVTLKEAKEDQDRPPAPAGREATAYVVRRGDTVSELLSRRFGGYGTPAYRRALARFQRLNPEIRDLDWILAGQRIRLPALSDADGLPSAFAGGPPVPPADPVQDRARIVLSELARALGARLLGSGRYFFPAADGVEVALDLSRTPVLEMGDGTRIVLGEPALLDGVDWKVVGRHWKQVRRIPVPAAFTVRQVVTGVMDALAERHRIDLLSFIDRGVQVQVRGQWLLTLFDSPAEPVRQVCITLVERPEQATPEPLIRYLEQRDIVVRDFVADTVGAAVPPPPAEDFRALRSSARKVAPAAGSAMLFDLLSALRYTVEREVRISFPYAGIQVNAVTNLISLPDGNPVFLDFGNLYGDAVSSIRKSGFAIIDLDMEKETLETAAARLLEGLGAPVQRTPLFLGAGRDPETTVSLAVPGFLTKNADGQDTLISFAPLSGNLEVFLAQRGIGVVSMAHAGPARAPSGAGPEETAAGGRAS
jgi:hypothetical protein